MVYKLELTFTLGQSDGCYSPMTASLVTVTSKPSDCVYGCATSPKYKNTIMPSFRNVYIESDVYFKTEPTNEDIEQFANCFKEYVGSHLKEMMEGFKKPILYWDYTTRNEEF